MLRPDTLRQTFRRASLVLVLAFIQRDLPGIDQQIDYVGLAQAGAPTYYFSSYEHVSEADVAVTWGVETNGDQIAVRYDLFLAEDKGISGLRVTLGNGAEVTLDEVAGVELSGIDGHVGDVETLWKVWRNLGGGNVEEVGIIIKRHDTYVSYPAVNAPDVVVSEWKHAQFLDVDECLRDYKGQIGGIRLSTEYCDQQGLVYPAEITGANRWDQVSEWSAAAGQLAEMFELAEREEGRWCIQPKEGDTACRAVLALLPIHVWNELLPAPF
jgi:hypothetical protein